MSIYWRQYAQSHNIWPRNVIYSAQFGRRIAGSTAAVASPDWESDNYSRTCESCAKQGAKYPETVGKPISKDAGKDANNTYAILCWATAHPPLLWRPWISKWKQQFLRPRSTRCSTPRKLARWTWWSGKHWFDTLLLDSWNMCPYSHQLQETGRRPQEWCSVV